MLKDLSAAAEGRLRRPSGYLIEETWVPSQATPRGKKTKLQSFPLSSQLLSSDKEINKRKTNNF